MSLRTPLLCAALGLAAAGASAHDGPRAHRGGIATPPAKTVKADLDIFHTKITTEGNVAVFHIAVSGKAGAKSSRSPPAS